MNLGRWRGRFHGRKQARQARAFDEAGAQKLLEDNDAESGNGGGERVMMKNRDAGERRGEKQKIDQHREIVSAELKGHASVPAGTVVD